MTPEEWIVKADRNLSSAALLALHGDSESACSRAYYAIFNAARAALHEVGQPRLAMSKSHSGMIAAFSEHLVKAGLISAEIGRLFGLESKRRIIADYLGDAVSSSDAADAVSNSTRFVAAIKAWLAAKA